MRFDVFSFIVVMTATIIAMVVVSAINDRMYKSLGIVFLTMYCIYSGIGFSFYEIDHEGLFLVQYCLGALVFAICLYAYRNRVQNYIHRRKNTDEWIFELNNGLIIKIMVIVYLLTYVFPFIYPSFRLFDIFHVGELFSNYHSVSSSVKAATKNDAIYQLVCSTLRTLVFPAFYIYLYKIKDKPVKFIILFVLPTYLYAIERYYLFRSDMLVLLVFIFIYLYKEEIFPRSILKLIAGVSVPIVFVLFGALFYIRQGVSVAAFSAKYLVADLISAETSFIKNYNTAADCSGSVSGIMFFIYVLTGFIPMSIKGFFGVKEINLAQVLSNNILGITYGSKNYYLLLPSVLGEGIMVFDKYFAFLYLGIVAIIFGIIFKWVRRNDSQYYLAVFLILDIMRGVRGGSQFIFTTWAARLVPFMFLMLLIRNIYKRRG